MKYEKLYPDAVNPQKRFPQALLGPHPEVIVSPGVAQTWRVYPCAACKALTGFRLELGEDFPMVPCCSEECAAELQKPVVDGAVVQALQQPLPEGAIANEDAATVQDLVDALGKVPDAELEKVLEQVVETDPVLAQID